MPSFLRILTLILGINIKRVHAIFDWYKRGDAFIAQSPYSQIGTSVATSRNGEIVVVSSPEYSKESYYGKRNGAVRCYVAGYKTAEDSSLIADDDTTQNSSIWFPLGTAMVGLDYQEFGKTVALSSFGLVLAVGSPSKDVGDIKSAGQVQLYAMDYSTSDERWVPMGNIITGTVPFDETGSAIALSDNGKVLAVGSPGFDDLRNGTEHSEAGQVQVYEYMNLEAKWKPLGEPLIGMAAYDRFGSAIGMSDDGLRLVVGAPEGGPNGEGYVQVFEFSRIDGSWKPIATPIFGSDKGCKFGYAVSMSSNGYRFIVGAPLQRGPNSKYRAGEVRVYEGPFTSTNSAWTRKGTAIYGLRDGDEFGTSLDMSSNGESFIVGAPSSTRNGLKNAGHAVVYFWSDFDKDWDRMGFDLEGKDAFDGLGQSVSISGDGTEVVVGAPGGGYAMAFHLLATRAPTQAPAGRPNSNGPSTGIRRFGKFLQIAIIAVIAFLLLFGALKGYQYLKKRQLQQGSTPVPGNELEMTAETAVRRSIENDLRRTDDDAASEDGII